MFCKWRLGVNADIIYVYVCIQSSYIGLSRERYVVLRGNMEFSDILQSMKYERGVKYFKFWEVLDSLRTVWQVFDTFSIFWGKQN